MKEIEETKEENITEEIKEVVKKIYVPFFTTMWLKSNKDVFDLNNNCGVIINSDKDTLKRYAELDLVNLTIADLRNAAPIHALPCLQIEAKIRHADNLKPTNTPKLVSNPTPKEIRNAMIIRKQDTTEIDNIIKSINDSVDLETGGISATVFSLSEDQKDTLTEKFIRESFDFLEHRHYNMFKTIFYVLNGFRLK